jgi:hypothetical protein
VVLVVVCRLRDTRVCCGVIQLLAGGWVLCLCAEWQVLSIF